MHDIPSMAYFKISHDVKLAAMHLYECDILDLPNILDCLRMSKSTFYQVLNLWVTTGDVVKHTFGLCGCLPLTPPL